MYETDLTKYERTLAAAKRAHQLVWRSPCLRLGVSSVSTQYGAQSLVDAMSEPSRVGCRWLGGLLREHHRLDTAAARELKPGRRSLLHLERLRPTHGLVPVILILGLLGWAIPLWQLDEGAVDDVVLVCMLAGLTLSIWVLSATPDKGSVAGTNFASKR